MLKKQLVLHLDTSTQPKAFDQPMPLSVHTVLVQLLARLVARSAKASEPSPKGDQP